MEGSSVDATNTIPTHCRAVVYKSYFEGTGAEDKVSSVLSMDEKFPVETLDAGMLLVRVKACSVNPVDWKTIAGVFGRYIPSAIGGPRFSSDGTVPVADGSGVVVRSRCPDFKPGDEVVWDNAARFGSLREFSTVRGVECTLKPKNLSFVETTANVGLASGTAVAGVDYLINYLKKPEKLTVTLFVCLVMLLFVFDGLIGSRSWRCRRSWRGCDKVSESSWTHGLHHCFFAKCGVLHDTGSGRGDRLHHQVTFSSAEFVCLFGCCLLICVASKWVDALPGKIDAIFQCVGSAQDLEWAEKVGLFSFVGCLLLTVCKGASSRLFDESGCVCCLFCVAGCFVSCDSGKSGLMSNVVSAIGTKISKPFHYNLFLNKVVTQNKLCIPVLILFCLFVCRPVPRICVGRWRCWKRASGLPHRRARCSSSRTLHTRSTCQDQVTHMVVLLLV
jgi:hypothetical protein